MSSILYWYKGNVYLNITNKCSNNCCFCIRNFKDGISGFRLKLDSEPSSYEAIQELQNVINRRHWNEVVFYGFGEPTIRIDEVLEITRWIKKYHHNIVRIDTNAHGYLLNPGRKVAEELREAGVDKISVSVNADKKDLYNRICRPPFENAFDNVLELVEKSKGVFDTEITFVAIPEVDKIKVEELARNMKVKLRERLTRLQFCDVIAKCGMAIYYPNRESACVLEGSSRELVEIKKWVMRLRTDVLLDTVDWGFSFRANS